MLLPSRNTSCASLRFLPPHRAASTSRSPNAELHGDTVNEPAGASQKVRDLLVAESRVRDDHIPDRSMRPSCACPLHKPNPYHFSGCVLDVPVTTHSPLKEGSHIRFATRWRS